MVESDYQVFVVLLIIPFLVVNVPQTAHMLSKTTAFGALPRAKLFKAARRLHEIAVWTLSIAATCVILPEFVRRWGTDQNQYSDFFMSFGRYIIAMVVGLTAYLTANLSYDSSYSFWIVFVHHTGFIVACAAVFTPLANYGFMTIYGIMSAADCTAEASYFVFYHLSSNMALKAKLAKAYQRMYLVLLVITNALALTWTAVHAPTNPVWQTITYPIAIAFLWLPAQLLWVVTWGSIHDKCANNKECSSYD